MAVCFIYAASQGRHYGEYTMLTGEQELMAQQMANQALETASGRGVSKARLSAALERYDEINNTLKAGDHKGLPPLPSQFAGELESVERSWLDAKPVFESVLMAQEPVAQFRTLVEDYQGKSAEIATRAQNLLTYLGQRASSPGELYGAGQLTASATRVAHAVDALLNGGGASQRSSESIVGDAEEFALLLDALAGDVRATGVSRLVDPSAVKQLTTLRQLSASLVDAIPTLKPLSGGLMGAQKAAANIGEVGESLRATTHSLGQALRSDSRRLDLVFNVGALAGVLLALSIVGLGYAFWRDSQRRIELTSEQNRRNQRAILRLLNEMSELAEGDLTTHATVTEDITGAIADSVNYAIDALRNLVVTINNTSVQIASASNRTRATADNLVEASSVQSREMASASNSIEKMARSMKDMSADATRASNVALTSIGTAAKGAEAVRQTISGMDNIREQIQETSKRIKRLGESSQEIGDIIGLIDEIADRTNILALNAAIQASTAGESGRGFAVVADEVQRLAESVGDATKQVEALVSTIQADTHEAIASMEQSTAGVVRGARLAENAGGALNEIELVSKQIAELVQEISHGADAQAKTTDDLSRNMSVIRDITVQTSQGTKDTAVSIENLTSLSEELRSKVQGFKLPPDADSTLNATGLTGADFEFDKTVVLHAD